MELEIQRWFTFKCALYSVANNLTSHDVEHIKFLLADCFPRQELEKTKNGFGLLCLLCTRRELLSPNGYSFLEELLREVGKSECLKDILSDTTAFQFSSMLQDTHLDADQSTSLQLEFLDCLAEELTTDNAQTLGLFFAEVCESISYANAAALISAKDLFGKLQESQIIGVGHLLPLHTTLVLIGRLDLASTVEQFCSGNWQSNNSLEPS